MVRALALGLVVWVSVLMPARTPSAAKCTPVNQCCKVCDKGQACGNSCISRAKTCHKGKGCACDAADICPGQ